MSVQLGDVCKNGHVIEGDNAQSYVNRGRQHIRCAECNKPPRNPAKKPGDTCKHGHVIEGDNLGQRNVSGRVQYYCRQCKKDQMRRYSSSESGRMVMNSKRYDQTAKKQRHAQKRAAERADEMIKSGKEEQALNYLKLAKRADRASSTLQKAIDERGAKCLDNPAPYVDYDDENPPTKDEAYELCRGCPVLIECARFANVYRPEVGIWGGEVYESGKILYK